ncbi:MAG TPA: hypothetical protein VHR86_07335 [Armatimonadota bacterium]|nr:hypothetical protein [Armatimonadota bacterium]
MPGLDPALLTALAGMVTFPERAVQPGDTWTDVIPAVEGQVNTKLVDTTREKGRSVARLKQSFALPLRIPGGNTGRQAGDLSIRFDCEAGRIDTVTGQVDTILDLENGAQHLDLLLKLSLTPEPAARKTPQAPGENTRANG